MTDIQADKMADLLESTWSRNFYRKDHESLSNSILTLMADCDMRIVLSIIRDYANNYDNAPNIATISRLAHMPREQKPTHAKAHPKYFEDPEGCGYLWNERAQDYDCVWKWWWKAQGKSKMATLKECGAINY